MENNKALRPGTVLRGELDYRIERVLGAGGFGITYLASCDVQVGSLSVEAFVAVKEHFMSDHCNRGGDATSVICPGTDVSQAIVANSLKDFVAEARRLKDYGSKHPNIVKVNEIFEANGTAYYVMEYLKGRSLSDYIREHGPLSEADIASLVYPVVDAAAYLHRERVTHLDIKPGNIMLAENKVGSVRPVLIDFGLSKHYNADGSATSTVNTMACSDGFAPLEQYKGIRTFSPAADVYALGATLYTAATSHNPSTAGEFPFGEPAATIAALPLSERLRTVMTRAMAMNKDDRYPDAGAMLAALGIESARTEGVGTVRLGKSNETKPLKESDKPKPVAPATRPNRKGMIIGAAIAAVVILGAILGFTISRGGESAPTPDLIVGDTLIAEVIEPEVIPEPAVAPEPAQPAGPTPEEIAAAERQEQEAAAERERQRQEAEERERQRQEAEERERQRQEAAERELKTPHNLDLAVRRGGQTYYFNQSNWRSLMQPGDEKLGVVIIKDGQRFILSLTCTEEMTWNEAMSRYSNVMPTKKQGEAMASQHADVNNAIRSFGGNVREFDWYWTKTEYDSSTACSVYMSDGNVYVNRYKTYTGRVRAVAPVPSSAI